MGESAWVDDHKVALAASFMKTVNDGSLVIRLEMAEGDVFGFGLLHCCGGDVGKCRAAVDMRLSGSKKIEVWA